MQLELDPWQKEVLETEGNICLRAGRQVGKSTIIAQKATLRAIRKRCAQLIIAPTERQAYLLFEKILANILDEHKSEIKKGKDRPTKHIIKLKNGSMIYCLPTGLSGAGIRGFTIDHLYADEADYMSQEVWSAVTPMLATTRGTITLLSSCNASNYEIGFFYKCTKEPDFKQFKIPSEMCPRITKEFLAREERRLTKSEFIAEYLAEWPVGVTRFFSDEVIEKCLVLNRSLAPSASSLAGDNFLGGDIAQLGGDETVLASGKRIPHPRHAKLMQIDMEITTNTRLTDTINRIKIANKKWNYNRIYLDDGGMGVGVVDPLLEDPEIKRKVIGLNNSSRGIDADKDDGRKKPLLKETLYNNLLWLMEQGKIELFNEDEIALSLRSIQKEFDTKTRKLHIWGRYTHITEALIRLAWCMRDKHLNIYIA